MASLKRGALVASILILVAMIASACNQPYSQQPSVTNTPIDPNSLFATPLGSATQMSDVQIFATGTALALQAGTPGAGVIPQTPLGITPQNATATGTATPTSTSTSTLAVIGTLPTSVPVGTRPSTYTLQPGEFVYCIARRFDVDPDQILSINGIVDSETVYPGTVLKIPQTGSFPGARALRNHPATYTVASAGETVYGVACTFGDIDPSAIAQANNISVGAALSLGQQLSIP